MTDEFASVQVDPARAAAYARREYAGTYYLAVRDLPGILARHVSGKDALDFGCGSGRSTRFLRELGYHAVGVDVAEPVLAEGAYDLVFAAFTFDNIPTAEKKAEILLALRSSLKPRGRIVIVVSDPALYRHEWASFSTRDFPENRQARSGDVVRLKMLDVHDRRPVEGMLCTPEAYRESFQKAGLIVLEAAHPLGRDGEPYVWVSETSIAPWTIYVLRPPVAR